MRKNRTLLVNIEREPFNNGNFHQPMSRWGNEDQCNLQHSMRPNRIRITGASYVDNNVLARSTGFVPVPARTNFQLSSAARKSGISFSGSRGRGSAIRVKSNSMANYRMPQNNEVEGASMADQTPYNEGENEKPPAPVPKAEVGMMAAAAVNSQSTFGRRIQLRENGHEQPHQLAYGNIAQNDNATQRNGNVAPVMCNHQDNTGNRVDMAKIFRGFAAIFDNFADNLEQNYHH